MELSIAESAKKTIPTAKFKVGISSSGFVVNVVRYYKVSPPIHLGKQQQNVNDFASGDKGVSGHFLCSLTPLNPVDNPLISSRLKKK